MAVTAKTPRPFLDLANLCRALEATTKRNEKIALIAGFLRSLTPEEVGLAALFLSGKAFPESDPRVLEVSYATISEAARTQGQAQLTVAPLTIKEVYSTLEKISDASGPSSRVRKLSLLQALLTRASSVEAEFLSRMMMGEMRIGVVEGVLLDSIAEASGVPHELVRRASMLHGDLGDLAKRAMVAGKDGLERIGLRLFMPVKPMLAEMGESIEQVLDQHRNETAFEYKFDGARIQIHRDKDRVRIYSRRLTDVTDSLPEIVDFAKARVRSDEYLIEGEVVAIGEGGKPVPFQDLMRRFRRVHDIEDMAGRLPLRLYLFDVLHVSGRTLIDLPYSERWNTLAKIAPRDSLAPRLLSSNPREVEAFLKDALKAGHEGLMAKSLSSDYSPGARGKKWFKLKPADTLDAVIVAADRGSGRRVGWLSNFHLAVRDELTGEFLVIGKTFKGLTDAEFEMITQRLHELKIRESRYTVHVKPSIVAEVAYNEVQKSPRYKSGFALRFARISRFREDKGPEDADTLQHLRELYEKQFENKARVRPDDW
jgi:DNA ligase 1